MSDIPVRPMLERPHHQQEARMSARGVLSVVGSAVGGLIGWTDTPPAADPTTVRRLLEDLGLRSGADLVEGLRAFQARTGLRTDGIAGPRTVHLLSRYAKEARDLHRLDLAA
jgi:murein L,D-transpeptidase YcbB/YkuD